MKFLGLLLILLYSLGADGATRICVFNTTGVLDSNGNLPPNIHVYHCLSTTSYAECKALVVFSTTLGFFYNDAAVIQCPASTSCVDGAQINNTSPCISTSAVPCNLSSSAPTGLANILPTLHIYVCPGANTYAECKPLNYLATSNWIYLDKNIKECLPPLTVCVAGTQLNDNTPCVANTTVTIATSTTTSTTTTTTPTSTTTTTTTPTSTTTTTTTTTTPTSTTTDTSSTTTTPTTTTTTPTSTTTTPTSTTTDTSTITTTPTSTTTHTSTTNTSTTTSISPTVSAKQNCHPSDNLCTTEGMIEDDPSDCSGYKLCCKDDCKGLIWTSQICPPCSAFANDTCSHDATECEAPQQIYAPICSRNDSVLPDQNDPTKYYVCNRIVEDYLAPMHRDCHKGYLYNVDTGMCSTKDDTYVPPKSCGSPGPHGKYQIPRQNCMAVNKSPLPPFYYDSVCTACGIFPYALDCSRYVICAQNPCTQKIDMSIQNCPPTTYFDVTTSTCIRMDLCKCLCTTREPDYTCTEVGNNPDPTCPSQYYSCSQEHSVTFMAVHMECLGGVIFDPHTGLCSNFTDINDFNEYKKDLELSVRKPLTDYNNYDMDSKTFLKIN